MPSDSPLLPVQTRRARRRLILYVFGSTVLILVLHATFSSSPLIAEGVNPHYDRYTQSVNEWKSKGAAAFNGAVDGWRQASGKTGYEEEAQEYLEVDEGYMVNGVRVDYDPMVGIVPEQGQRQREGVEPVVQEVDGAEAAGPPENKWEWPAAWPAEEHQPEQQQVEEQQWQEPPSPKEETGEQQFEAEQQEDAPDQQNGQVQEEQNQQFEPEHDEPSEQGQQDQQPQQEEGDLRDGGGVSWEEIKEDGEAREEQEEPQDEPFRFEPEQIESQHGDDRQDGQDTGMQGWQSEAQQQQQDGQSDSPRPPSDAQFDRYEPQASAAGDSSDQEGFPPPEPQSNSEETPTEPPSTERFPFSMNLPDNLPPHDPSDQPRIVILQHVFPSGTVSRKLFSLSEAAYKAYADYWGYTYVRDDGVYMPNEYEARRKGMNKLYPVLKVMIEELGKEDGAEWMLMTDADTIPINPSIPVHHLIPPSPDVWFMGNEDWNGFNAGNMLLRISRETVAFMSHVIAREVDMSRYEHTGKYVSAPPSDQEALCQSFAEEEWKDHFYRVPMKWFNAYSSPYEPTQENGGPVNLPWTDGGEQQEGVWTPQLNFHLVFILKHYRETEDLKEQMERVWRKMADDESWARDVQGKTQFAAGMWWSQYKDGEDWRVGVPPKCMGF